MVRAKEKESREEAVARLSKAWPELNLAVLASHFEEVEPGKAWKLKDTRPAVLDSSYRRR
jgi:hypothetical protein